MNLKKKLFGDRAFYKYVIALALPIMIQNGITNLVNMLDNLMIGGVGPNEMYGVSLANQLIFVFNICIFGAVAGAGIFGSQFAGTKDYQGIAYTMRFKMYVAILLTVAGIVVLTTWDTPLISLYLEGDGSPEDIAASLTHAKDYLKIMLWGLPPFALSQCYAGTLRETGRTKPPMVAGITAVAVNLVGNTLLIYGLLGAPELGVKGAAIATVLSRYVELAVLVAWTHLNPAKNPYAPLIYRSFRIPLRLMGQIALRGLPLLLNEAAWSVGLATLNRQYTLCGLDMGKAQAICQTFWNVFSVSFMAVGISVGIILGQQLGAGKHKQAKEDSVRLIVFATLLGIGVTIVYCIAAPFIPYLYQGAEYTDAIRRLATQMMIVSALSMPIDAFAFAAYSTLRSGGKTFITFLFDSCYMWIINIPVAILLVYLCRNYDFPFVAVYGLSHASNIFKCFLGTWLVKKGIWIKKIVD